MTKKYNQNISDYLEPYYINGLESRMLKTESRTTKRKNILFVYDLLDSLENSWELINDLRNFGHVSSVDLPGIGGMNSFYSIGYRPTIDNYADFLATFVKLRFKRGKIILAGKGFGFAVITRMLQKYPEIHKRTTTVLSINGHVHNNDFNISKTKIDLFKFVYNFLAIKPMAYTSKKLFSNSFIYQKLNNKLLMKFLIYGVLNIEKDINSIKELFKKCDASTHWLLVEQLLALDNCQHRLNIKLLHAYYGNDLINHSTQRQHFQVSYKSYKEYKMIPNKAEETEHIHSKNVILPKPLRRVLANAKA